MIKRKQTIQISSLVAILVLCAWVNASGQQIKKAGWLVGTWENQTKNGSVCETWIRRSDIALFGKSYAIREKDTVIFETVQLVEERDSLFYIPIVKDQNSNLPVRFSAKLIADGQLVFENAKHDFPQIISYTKIATDSLVAEISGKLNGEDHKQTFRMRRVK